MSSHLLFMTIILISISFTYYHYSKNKSGHCVYGQNPPAARRLVFSLEPCSPTNHHLWLQPHPQATVAWLPSAETSAMEVQTFISHRRGTFPSIQTKQNKSACPSRLCDKDGLKMAIKMAVTDQINVKQFKNCTRENSRGVVTLIRGVSRFVFTI